MQYRILKKRTSLIQALEDANPGRKLYELEFEFPRDQRLSVYNCCCCPQIHTEHAADAKLSAPNKDEAGLDLSPLGYTAVPVPGRGGFSHRNSVHRELAINEESELRGLATAICKQAAARILTICRQKKAQLRDYKRAREGLQDQEWVNFLAGRNSSSWNKL